MAITRVPVSGLVGDELLRARHEIGGEVRALGGLQHDRLTRAMDVVLDADDLWVASELLPGVTMADELARRGVVGPEEAGVVGGRGRSGGGALARGGLLVVFGPPWMWGLPGRPAAAPRHHRRSVTLEQRTRAAC
ncbi:MAG: hypothetical protein ACRDRP_18680 [Pseudonocardiaceae bacterium]